MIASPRSAARASATSRRSSDAVPTITTSAPSASTRARLIAGASEGMTMTAGTPNSRAARATPWAWLPDEYVMRPRARASGVSEAAATYAPRSLNAPIGWRLSALSSCRRSGAPNGTSGVRSATPRSVSAAARIAGSSTRSGSGCGVGHAPDATAAVRPG